MELSYSQIENGVKDFLRLQGRETNQHVIAILTEMVIMLSYSASESFNLLHAPRFVEHVNTFIQNSYLRENVKFNLRNVEAPKALECTPKDVPPVKRKRGRKKKEVA